MHQLSHFAQRGSGHFQAGVDLGGSGHVEQHLGHLIAARVDVDAANGVGRVLALRHQPRLHAGRAAIGQAIHRSAARLGREPAVGMDGGEQVGIGRLRLLHPRPQRHEVVAVARHHHLHVRRVHGQVAQVAGDEQHHILLVHPAGARGARVFAAMTGVDRQQHAAKVAAVAAHGVGALWRGRRIGAGELLRLPGLRAVEFTAVLADPVAKRIGLLRLGLSEGLRRRIGTGAKLAFAVERFLLLHERHQPVT